MTGITRLSNGSVIPDMMSGYAPDGGPISKVTPGVPIQLPNAGAAPANPATTKQDGVASAALGRAVQRTDTLATTDYSKQTLG